MQFSFDEDQLSFRDTVRDLLAKQCTPDVVRRAWEGDALDRGVWDQLAEMGVLGILAAEDAGGMGLDHLLNEYRHGRACRIAAGRCSESSLIRCNSVLRSRSQALPDSLLKVIPLNVQEGFVETSIGSAGEVLGGGRGPDSVRSRTYPAGSNFQSAREVVAELPEHLRRDDEPRWHLETLCRELGKSGCFAAQHRPVCARRAKLRKLAYSHGSPSSQTLPVSNSRGASFDHYGVAPLPREWAKRHPGNSIPPADNRKALRNVEPDARFILGKDAGLDRPDSCFFRGGDQRAEKGLAYTQTTGFPGHIN